jgi:hypothetical protein
VKLINLDAGDEIAAIAKIAEQEEDEEALVDLGEVVPENAVDVEGTETDTEKDKEAGDNNNSVTGPETEIQ